MTLTRTVPRPTTTPRTTEPRSAEAQSAEAQSAEAQSAEAGGTAAAARPSAGGLTVWLTGLPSAGKSTLADASAQRLRAEGLQVQVLDGDEVRPHLSPGLGFSQDDRNANVLRIGWVARLLAANAVVVLVPVIAPYAVARDQVRRAHRDHGVDFAEVYVSTPVAVTARRDVKGLYALQAAGKISGLTGVDDPYEPPTRPELVLDTDRVELADGCARIVDLVHARLADRAVDGVRR